VHFLRDNVFAGCHRWKNNGCESLNHVLKQCVQWRPNKLPDLIDKLQNVVDAQYVDADWALLGYGDFVLRPQYARHHYTLQDWGRMAACQKNKAVEVELCFRLPARSNAVTSTDGRLTVSSAPSGGRKPCPCMKMQYLFQC